MLPCATGVGTLVDSVAVRCHDASNGVLAHADINYVGVIGCDRDGADRSTFELTIRNVLPGNTGIGGLPNSTAGAAHVIGQGIPADTANGIATTPSKGTDVAKFER